MDTLEHNGFTIRAHLADADRHVIAEVYEGDCYRLRQMKVDGFEPRLIVDVGAHIGTFSRLCTELWPDARLVVIEPNVESFELAKRNVPDAVALNLAIGDGEPAQWMNAPHQPGSSFISTNASATWKREADGHDYAPGDAVETVPFEVALAQAGIEFDAPIDLLKLDCEGGEWPLLEAMTPEMAQRIGRVVGEYHSPYGWEAFKTLTQDALPHLEWTSAGGEIAQFEAIAPDGSLKIHQSAGGVGDTVCGFYVAAGLALAAGQSVRYYTRHPDWLARVSHEGVTVYPYAERGTDMFAGGYGTMISEESDRKAWLCQNVARALGVPAFDPLGPHHVDRDIGDAVEHECAVQVLLSPFTDWSQRMWPHTHWRRLAFLLREAGLSVAAIGSLGHEMQLREMFGDFSGFWWYFGKDADWVMRAMLRAQCVVGNDSGMVHVAGLLGVPTVAIHAQHTPEALFSLSDVASAYPETKCAGCAWQASRGWSSVCGTGCSALASVSPERVAEMILNVPSLKTEVVT